MSESDCKVGEISKFGRHSRVRNNDGKFIGTPQPKRNKIGARHSLPDTDDYYNMTRNGIKQCLEDNSTKEPEPDKKTIPAITVSVLSDEQFQSPDTSVSHQLKVFPPNNEYLEIPIDERELSVPRDEIQGKTEFQRRERALSRAEALFGSENSTITDPNIWGVAKWVFVIGASTVLFVVLIGLAYCFTKGRKVYISANYSKEAFNLTDGDYQNATLLTANNRNVYFWFPEIGMIAN